MKKVLKTMMLLFAVTIGTLIVTGVSGKAATITPVSIVTGGENVNANTNSFVIPANNKQSNVVSVAVPSAGTVYFNVLSSMLTDNVKLSLWKDKECKYPAASSYESEGSVSPNEVKTIAMPVLTAGTYYLKMNYSYYNSDSAKGSITMSTSFISRADRDLAANVNTVIPPKYNSTVTYVKVTVPVNGYIGITQANTKGNSITLELCNANKTIVASRGCDANAVYYYPVAKGTYYIKTTGIYDGITYLKYTTTTGFSASAGRTFNLNVLDTCTFDVKIKANKTGLMSLSALNYASFYATLLDSKKRPLTQEMWNWHDTNSMGVQKNKVYYIRIKASIGSDTRSFVYSIAGAKTAKNTSKKKAIKLKKNKKVSQIILSGDKKARYYKFKLTKKKKLNISFTNVGTGQFKYSLLNSKGKRLYVSNDTSAKKLKTYSKIPKGTYYIKIKMQNKSTGRFTFKLK